jgi:hypothetical protein
MIRALLLAVVFLPAAAQAASNNNRWVHVSIDGADDERVRVNVPLKLVRTLEPLLESHDLSDDVININGRELTRKELETILKAVREADEGEYITVFDDEDQVRVAKEKKQLAVRVIEKQEKGKDKQVNIRIPIPVVEALLSGEGTDEGQLNLVAALEALGRHDSGEVISVNDGEDRIRIWVDGKNESD